MNQHVLSVKKVRDVKTPERGTRVASGIDFFIPNDLEEITIQPFEDVMIPSGIKVLIPEGYDLVFDNKGGVATKKKLIMGAKVVDQDFQGEVFLHVINTSDKIVTLYPGEKLTQGIIRKVELFPVVEVDEITWDNNERGTGERGSTGDGLEEYNNKS